MEFKRVTNEWVTNQVKRMRAKEGYASRKVYEALCPHFLECGYNLECIVCIEFENGKCYFLRNACLKLKMCIEVESSAIKWRSEQEEKVRKLREFGFKVFFVDSHFTRQDCAGLVLAVMRYLGKAMLLKDGKRANEHNCLDCCRCCSDADKEVCEIFRHHVNIWDKGCAYFNSEGFVPDVCAEPEPKPEPKPEKKHKKRKGISLLPVEARDVPTVGFFTVPYKVPGFKVAKDVRVYREPVMSMGTCRTCSNYSGCKGMCAKLGIEVKDGYSCTVRDPANS